jgi:NADH:ubiquinone oxidoreductase subunit F (NADH-binding)/NADH:ubiquinone oxidoreductase subunit E
MRVEKIEQMQNAHEILCEFPFEIKELDKGYSNQTLRIDLDKNEITIQPVTQQMKDLWVGGKGFDLWLMLQEINKDTKWDSPENPICFSSGPLGGTTSFPGSGKTLVTAVSPLTHSVIDCNVGGYFGPFMKFAGFDALSIVGKAKDETIIYIDAVKKRITIERAPQESIDAHLLAEELTEMYADDDLDKRNIATVCAGRGAQYTRVGVLNFSFWDWRRNVARLKQAGRGGVGTVFRDKKIKALVIKNRDITPAWRIEESKVAKWVTPKKISIQGKDDIAVIEAIIEKWGNDPEHVIEMMLEIQARFHHISKTAIDLLLKKTNVPKAYLYHTATFYKDFSLEEKKEPPAGVHRGPACHLRGSAAILDLFDRGLNIKADQADKTREEINLFSRQPLIALRNKGLIDPENIDQYVARGGYHSLKKVLAENNPEGIIQQILRSGIRGRGGGGFPTGLKWQAGYEAKEQKNEIYVVCNADEGDPAAFTARGIFEADPHSVIEGMLIGAFVVGAREGFIYLNKEYTLARQRLDKAITTARKKEFLGDKIQGTDFAFDIKVRRGPGDFVGGEATALTAVMSGRAGEPRFKYMHGTESGFRDKPTIINDVETWANIPVIIEKGAEWFAAIGTGDVSQDPWNGSSGTKVFSLVGDIRNSGLVEVPLGITLEEMIEDIGGGIPGDRQIKAVLVGGPSGGFIPGDHLHMKVDFETLNEAGAVIGSGGIIVMDDRTCIVDVVGRLTKFLAGESCGKCTPCREGLFALANALTRICSGEGKPGDLQFLENTAKTISQTSLCQLGGTAPNPLLSTLRYFREEYEEHIKNKKCPAGVCKHLGASK